MLRDPDPRLQLAWILLRAGMSIEQIRKLTWGEFQRMHPGIPILSER